MDGDKPIEENEYGKLIEREIDGNIRKVFIISQKAFDKAYWAHQNWYERFKNR